jgi:exosortase/archaeosortase family protein
VLIIIAVGFGILGYFIATSRVKQPFWLFMMRFGIVFFLLFFLDVVIRTILPSSQVALRNIAASLVSGFLTLTGAHHSITGSTITLQNPYLVFDITEACLGGLLLNTYGGLVLAESTATKKQRLTGILVGLAILLAFNFFRITLSIYLEGLTGFNVHHLFYYINMGFVLLVWLGWLRTIRRRPARVAEAMP